MTDVARVQRTLAGAGDVVGVVRAVVGAPMGLGEADAFE